MTTWVAELDGIAYGPPGHPLHRPRSFALGPGLTVLGGEPGSGKSTLLRLLAGADTPTQGRLTLQQEAVPWGSIRHKAQVFGVDPADPADDGYSAPQVWQRCQQRHPHWDDALAQALAAAFGLTPHLDKTLYMLSAGTRRKVWLVAAFAASTALTLLDEPQAGLDWRAADLLGDLLAEAAEHPTRAWLMVGGESLPSPHHQRLAIEGWPDPMA